MMTHMRMTFQLHIESTLRLGIILTQLDDDGQEFMVAYASQFNNKLKSKYNSYKKMPCGCLVYFIVYLLF
jgi:hypothetical protein